jgi:anti-sigma B factor antagonist
MTPRDAALGEPFELRTEQRDETVLITLSGALGAECADQFEREFEAGLGTSPGGVILDLRKLTFIDSTGLKGILSAQRRSRDRGIELTVTRGSGQVRRAFELTGLDRELTFRDDVPELEAAE